MTVRLSTKGQFVIPNSIRRKLSLVEGDLLDISLILKDKQIVLKPRKKINFLDLAGSLPDDGKPYVQIWEEAEKNSLENYSNQKG